jgi:hypothetical protein
MQIRCPDCVPRNYLQLCYSFLSLKTKIKSPNRPWKIICYDFGLTAQQGFQGLYLLAPLSELGLPHVQIKGIIVEAHNFGSQTFSIKVRLSLWIYTERSCCPELREYLSGWVDLVGKHPSPRSFACWCFCPWVVWSLVHFMSDLWRASWSSLELLDELILKVSFLTLIYCVNNKLQNRHASVNLLHH